MGWSRKSAVSCALFPRPGDDVTQTVRARLFARFRDLLDNEWVDIEAPAPATVADLRQALATRFPDIARLLAQSRVAVNQEFAEDAATVSSADEVALIPPVSGG
jgi:molybdopterin converting factor subunit 1